MATSIFVIPYSTFRQLAPPGVRRRLAQGAYLSLFTRALGGLKKCSASDQNGGTILPALLGALPEAGPFYLHVCKVSFITIVPGSGDIDFRNTLQHFSPVGPSGCAREIDPRSVSRVIYEGFGGSQKMVDCRKNGGATLPAHFEVLPEKRAILPAFLPGQFLSL